MINPRRLSFPCDFLKQRVGSLWKSSDLMIIRQTTCEANVDYSVEILPLLSVDLPVQFDTCVSCNGNGDVVGNE